MPQYMVTMSLTRADPLTSIGELTDIVSDMILPSLEALKVLQAKGKILVGGHPIGQRYIVLFMEAESEEEVRELLGGLPLSRLGETEVTELESFREMHNPSKTGTWRGTVL